MKALRVAAVLTIVGLAFMVWSLIQPTPMPVLLAMSVGQLFGTAAFAIYLYIVVRDIRRKWRKGERLLPWLKRFDHFTRPDSSMQIPKVASPADAGRAALPEAVRSVIEDPEKS